MLAVTDLLARLIWSHRSNCSREGKPAASSCIGTTSAIDSATEDQIQRAMRRISRQRTTFLITHRLSQIRWADRILVLRRGELVDQGTHEELMERSLDYRKIFARYD